MPSGSKASQGVGETLYTEEYWDTQGVICRGMHNELYVDYVIKWHVTKVV